jgi:hypothetical protein
MIIHHLAKFHLNELSKVCLKKQFVDQKCDSIPAFIFLISNRNIIKKQKAQSRYTGSTRETLEEEKKNKKIMKTKQIR